METEHGHGSAEYAGRSPAQESGATAEPGPPPLTGVTVLDLTWALAGPFATQILGDLGATIIKVEGPATVSGRTSIGRLVGDTTAYFLSVNRNKRSLHVDLKHPRGRQLVLQLASQADLVFENYRPGVLERLGLGFESLRDVNPDIVLCSISGFGQDGPYRDRGAFDVIVQAMSGGMSLTGEPGGPPVRSGIPIGDLCAGMFGVIGALASLHLARSTGEARHVDVAMFDSQVSMLSYQAVWYMLSGQVPGPQGRSHMGNPVYRSYACSDGVEIMVAPLREEMFATLARVLGRPDLPADPRFATSSARTAHADALVAELDRVFRTRPADEWLALLEEAGVPSGPINTVDRVVTDPQVRQRDMIVESEYQGHPLRLVGNPIKVKGTEQPLASPPADGEHTAQILSAFLGLDPSEIARLAAAGVVGAHRCPEPRHPGHEEAEGGPNDH